MKILLFSSFLLFFIATIPSASSEDIACECTISNVAFLYFKFVKTCSVKSKFTVISSNTTITSLNGKNSTAEPNKDVSFFYVFGKTMQYIPKGLDQLVANLTGMKFELTKLKHVTKENLAPFPQLLMFASVSNQVQFIEKDLFINNPNLKFVSFRSNKITYIDPAVFDVIQPNLAQLFIDGTAIACGLTQALSTSAVGKVIDKLKESACADIDNAPPLYTYWLEKQGGTENEDSDCEAEIAKKQDECDATIQDLQNTHEEMLACFLDPNPDPSCPTRDQMRSLMQK
ncbi:uncharacterized protein [Chironomus tepperi]|uniref:uncharacterized protein n=1 Tax=Chironomus tepperi TaxID=113505 RepID=UPI00391F01F9